MANIPFEKQLLPISPVEQIDHKIAHGMSVSGSELFPAIEWSVGHRLDDCLRELVNKFSVAAVKQQGRPGNNKGREDFALEEVDEKYPGLLQKYEQQAQQRRLLAAAEGAVLPSAERTPSEFAYTEILQEMKADFPNMGWQALRNKHSKWNNGHFHSAENHIDSEDYDAEIEHQFPTRPKS